MELVYSIDFSPSSKRNDFVTDERICCSLSCKNIVAFSQAREVDADNDGDKLDICFEVCVMDLDKPWQEYTVTTYSSPVTYMRWDPAGTTLLVVNVAGKFNLWRMKNFLLNAWEDAGTVDLDKEEVLVLAWLHNGEQVLFNPESSELHLYSEKFTRAKMSPSLIQFGKKPVEGWVAVTSTGMVHVGLIPEHTSSSSPLITAQACLSLANSHVAQADVAFMPDGQILIAVSDGQITSSVHCYIASLQLKNHQCLIRCNPSASFFLKRQLVQHEVGPQEPHLTKLSFLSRENSEVLLACWGTSTFSCIEVWHLVEQSVPLHKMFQNASVTEYAYKTKLWVHKSSISHSSGLTGIARPKLPISCSFTMESTNFLSYLACTYLDGTIKIIHRQSYQIIYKASLDQLINFKTLFTSELSSEPPEKRARVSVPHLVSAVQTNTGCGLVGLGEGRLYLFRMFNSREGSLQLPPAFVVLLLEYTMCVVLDVWDVLLAVRQGMIEGIVEKLYANFQKQSGAFQELLHQRLLHIKMALYSCLGPGNQRAADCRDLITLHAVTVVIKSCLRPKNVLAQDKGPAEKLASLCTVSMENDLDVIIKTLDPEDFVLDSMKKSGAKQTSELFVQSLQPYIQWVTDFILHLLAAVSMYSSYQNYPGASLLKDVQVLSLLRELLIIIRIWGKHNHACLPVFMTSVAMDPLPYLFRLITKAWISARDQVTMEDQAFVDECCNLPSKMLLPNFKKTYGQEMNCYLAFSQSFPINYQFGLEPDFLFNPRYSQRMFPFDLGLHAEQKYDCVRQTHLGVRPKEPLRECVRCCSVSLLRKPTATKSLLLRSWELRFIKCCLCGGHWKLQQLTAESNSRCV